MKVIKEDTIDLSKCTTYVLELILRCLEIKEGNDSVQEDFERLRLGIEETNTELLSKMNREPKRPWMTEDILMRMD